jgi:deoxyribose-phosphate aldolase
MNDEPISRTLDAALLKPAMTRSEILEGLDLCLRFNTRTACVRPCDIALAREHLKGSRVGVCAVLGFPHGDQLAASKADEARRYVDLGVDEIDMVANYGYALSGLWEDVQADIAAVTAITVPANIPLKVIFETSQLDLDTIRRLVEVCIAAQAQFVKTSTGFTGEGASEEAVRLMIETAAGRIRVKPSGGIRDQATARHYLGLGAHRLGVGYTSVPAICGDTEQPASTTGY